MGTVAVERQRLDPRDGRHVEIAIQMRKQRAAPRRLPLEGIAQLCGIDVQQHQAGLTGEMLCRRFSGLIGRGKMNEAIG